jgi:hypothetical protein
VARVVAFVTDLMDRSRLTTALDGVEFAREPVQAVGADIVLVDLPRFGSRLAEVRAAAPGARVVAFGPHVDGEAFAQALRDGADATLTRSRLFADPVTEIG